MHRRPELAGGWKASPADLAVDPERSPGTDVYVNVIINSRLREMLNVMFSDVCDRRKDL